MVNEAERCFQDKLVAHPRDVEIRMLINPGFAPFRGGLLKYADSEGLQKISETLHRFENEFGPRFKPADFLTKIKNEQGAFYN